jgi:hypothetical protein
LRTAYLCLLFIFLALPLSAGLASAPPPVPTPAPPPAPPGFELLDADLGVWLFSRPYPNGTPDYVQLLDLGQGAALRLLAAPIAEARTGKGVYGGDDPRFRQIPLQQFWQQAQAERSKAFCVTNGLFFYMPESPTRLAFPLKIDGRVITDGFGSRTYPGEHLMLELWEGRADIQPFSAEALMASDAPNIIGGLTEQANKRAKQAVGRTFVGIDDRDLDGQYETVLVLNTSTGTQAEVAATLGEFGADKVMMLDGGGSTQLLCRSGAKIVSERLIPQALAVIAGEPPPVAAGLSAPPEWPVAVAGQPVQLSLRLVNTGVETWRPGEHFLAIEAGPLGDARLLPLAVETPPGGEASFTWSGAAYSDGGLYPLEIGFHMQRGEKAFASQSAALKVVVLPQALENQQDALAVQVQEWRGEAPEALEQRINDWALARGESLEARQPPLSEIDFSGAGLVGVFVLVGGLALLLVFAGLRG